RKQVASPTRQLLYDEQRGKCTYCDKEITPNPEDFDVDHIIPVSLGGPTCLSNLHLLSMTCHKAKSGRERS
ncbi:unnamed protein product, partial [Ectocarpus fasciculatus]